MKRPNHQKKPWSPWLKAFFALVLVGVLSFCGLFAAVMYGSYNHITGDPQVMVILGCRVMPGGKPSMLLQDRLETALDYLEEDPDILVVVSGGQGSNEPVSEAACMAGWLEERGISEDRISDFLQGPVGPGGHRRGGDRRAGGIQRVPPDPGPHAGGAVWIRRGIHPGCPQLSHPFPYPNVHPGASGPGKILPAGPMKIGGADYAPHFIGI